MRYIPLDRVGELEHAITATIRCGGRSQVRDAIATALGLHGLRVSEVCRAAAADFSPTARTLHVATIKGGVPRDVPLHESLVQAIVRWRLAMALEPGVGPLLPTVSGRRVAPTQFREFGCRMMRRVFQEPFKFHALRHTFAMRVLAKTDDVLLVKRLLGHRSLTSTLVYVEALKRLPEDCLVRVDGPLTLDHYHGARLRLFAPAESG